MSCPLILPKGSDRSWTRAFYTTVNKIFRRMWWEQGMNAKVDAAALDCMVKGTGSIRILSNNHNHVQRAIAGED